jgi:hypothetical protein
LIYYGAVSQIHPNYRLRNLKQAFEKPEAEMSLEERTEKKKREIEEEFLRYKMARNGPDTEQGGTYYIYISNH